MNIKYTLYDIVMLITSIYEFIILNIRVLATLFRYQPILWASIHRLTALNIQTQDTYMLKNKRIRNYSKICIKRSPLGHIKSGLLRQVTS